jgi:hypothetical protein
VYARLNRHADVTREQAIIRRLTQEEQERNVRSHQSYGSKEMTLPGSISHPAPTKPKENR